MILKGTPGTAKITAVATRADLKGSATASYDIYVNAVTGISVSPATAVVKKNENTTITASYTTTEIGDDYASLPAPTFSWAVENASVVSISATSGTRIQAHGESSGNTIVSATIDESYVVSNINPGTCEISCVVPSKRAFRGYEVSKGILRRTVESEVASYSLTDGSNTFELNKDHYNKAASLNQYFFQWSLLKDELGAADNGRCIKKDSERLPFYGETSERWIFPGGDDWWTILFGNPLTEIQVNDNPVSTGFAAVKVNYEGVDYYGIVLLRDGARIYCEHLTKMGTAPSPQNSWTENQLNEISYEELVALQESGCLFIPSTGWHSGYEWKRYDRYEQGYYWTSDYTSNDNYIMFSIGLVTTGSSAGKFNVNAKALNGAPSNSYRAVRLVRLATDN